MSIAISWKKFYFRRNTYMTNIVIKKKKGNSIKLLMIILLLFSLGVSSGCSSKPAETAVRPGKIDAELAQRLLVEGNNRFVEGKTLKKDFLSSAPDPFQKNLRPFAVFLACSESDAPPEILFDRNIGDLLVVRTVGNVLDPIVLGSIEYGVEHYKAPLVVVLGHGNCGIIEEVIEAKEQCPGNIPLIQDKVKKAVSKAKEGGEKGDALLKRAAAHNVLDVIEELKTSHIIQEFKARHGIKIVGATYDAKSGKVSWLETGGCDLGDGFTIPDRKTESAKADSTKWSRPSEKLE
jgi:carbonic anhydrase